MSSRLDELETLRWLKECAAKEPQIPRNIETRLWARVSGDVSNLAVGSVAASLLHHGGSHTALSVWRRIIGSRFALWSAPALVAGAAAGAAGHAALSAKGASSVSSARVAYVAHAAAASAQSVSVLTAESLPLEPLPEEAVATRAQRAGKPALSAGLEHRSANLLTRERALLDPARGALASGDPARALQQTKRHAMEFPSGILSEEREAIAINALVTLGNYAEAKKRAASFRAQYPQSLQMHSVDAAMASVPRH